MEKIIKGRPHRLDATGAFRLCGGSGLRRVLVPQSLAHSAQATFFEPLAGGSNNGNNGTMDSEDDQRKGMVDTNRK